MQFSKMLSPSDIFFEAQQASRDQCLLDNFEMLLLLIQSPYDSPLEVENRDYITRAQKESDGEQMLDQIKMQLEIRRMSYKSRVGF